MNFYVQWVTLLWMLFSGAMMGVAFDSYRVLSGRLQFPKWSIHALDILYWSASAVFVFRMLYASNHGQLRFYVFLGLFLGVWLYFWILSVTTQRFVVMLIEGARQLWLLCRRIFHLLILMPLKGLYRILRLFLGLVWVITLFIAKLLLQLLLPFWKLLRWIVRPLFAWWVTPQWLSRFGRSMVAVWKRWF
ncbi:spore cortex biosynthesis protein YabQ [Paenibacillus sp. JX-17]|uniref:Spore cortex biosynthesis protein YabQ n=1 Tax=Paenibacillus lacisoli TaxID=3064525 RepID=A0ABT9CH29_9BACL|nr:spore cortex biosynthesis protein YabQ [Paenibacillus sp. JX-17]MDO7908582.1 spore cortex biosynthesis protein YabQ [Paenibacillus sp. JX-17]